MNYKLVVFVSTITIACFSSAMAEPYRPPIIEFNANNSINLPADNSLDLELNGTIEFWVAAKWESKLDYDPAILANSSGEGVRYSVHITADKQAIGMFSGEEWDKLSFDFSDGKLHYVALITYDGITDVMIDGELRGTIGVGYAEALIGDGFFIGSINGAVSPFIGSIAGLRIWDTAVDKADLVAFAAKEITSTEGKSHPDFQALIGYGVFNTAKPTFALTSPPYSYENLAQELIQAELEGAAATPESGVEIIPGLDESAQKGGVQ